MDTTTQSHPAPFPLPLTHREAKLDRWQIQADAQGSWKLRDGNPIAEMRSLMKLVQSTTGYAPDHLLLSADLVKPLCDNPQMGMRTIYGSAEAYPFTQLLCHFLDLKHAAVDESVRAVVRQPAWYVGLWRPTGPIEDMAHRDRHAALEPVMQNCLLLWSQVALRISAGREGAALLYGCIDAPCSAYRDTPQTQEK